MFGLTSVIQYAPYFVQIYFNKNRHDVETYRTMMLECLTLTLLTLEKVQVVKSLALRLSPLSHLLCRRDPENTQDILLHMLKNKLNMKQK